MPFFWKPYTSDTTDFITSLKKADPQLEARQREGRSLLWDRPQDRAAKRDFDEAKVPQQAYVYGNQARGPKHST